MDRVADTDRRSRDFQSWTAIPLRLLDPQGPWHQTPVASSSSNAAAGLYFCTAMTRARLATLIVGHAAVVARAAATPDTSRRYSRLGERLSSPER
jgi:hypothetical protein